MFLESFFQSLPYLFLLGFCLFLVKIPDQQKASYYFFLVLFLFSALRFDVGWDYMHYRISIENDDYKDVTRFEWLEQQLAFLSQILNFPQLFFIVNSFFTFLFLYLGIKNLSTKYSISYLVYLGLPIFFFSGLSLVRFTLTLSIVFWAYGFLLEKKILKFILVIILSFFIHKSSLIALLLIPLFYFPLNRIVNFSIFIVSLFISSTKVISSLLNNSYLMAFEIADDFKNYAEGGEDFGGFHKLPILLSLINALNLIFYNKLTNNGSVEENIKKSKIYITLYNFGCCIMLFFADNATLSNRLSIYFQIAILLIIPLYLQTQNGKFNQMSKIVISITLILLFIVQLTIPNYNGDDPNRWSTFLPYRFFLFN